MTHISDPHRSADTERSPETKTSPDTETSSARAHSSNERGAGVSRRSLLTGGAIGAGIGALLGAGGSAAASAALAPDHLPPLADPDVHTSLGVGGELPGFGGETLPCHGPHQAGITSIPASFIRYVSYRLKPEVDRADIERMFRIITGDIEGLSSGIGPLADPEPELAARPARLTVTVGVGAELVNRVNPDQRPEWLDDLPTFSLDQLEQQWNGGDLLIIMQADDPLPLSHAARMFERDLSRFASVAWVQQGFRQARGSEAPDRTMRNLMGQVDGTVNPNPEDDDFDALIWIDGSASNEAWLAGGTAFVLRRIRMELDTWDMVDRPGREDSIGRTLDTGAPLTGGDEFTPADFAATNALGLPVIPITAHIRRAHSADAGERIYRRAMNYDDGSDVGLLFGCYQVNPLHQFVPIQERLDELDMLNEWVTHIGSAVFAILPGFAPGELLGDTLMRSS